MRIDLHCHSSVSPDGWLSPLELVETAVAAGLDKVAITDHREIDGALEAFERYPDRVIVGEEIHCEKGTHIIGLCIAELIPSGKSVSETARIIREQGGLVYAPHPFAYPWNAGWHAQAALAEAEVVEVFNSRAFLPGWNRRAVEAARERGLPCAASSDSHFPWEFGRAYTELPAFSDSDGFRSALQNARPVGNRKGSPWLHVASKLIAETRRVVPGLGRSTGAPGRGC
jgi:predicted metal-dependent phosphoesterase TrpH